MRQHPRLDAIIQTENAAHGTCLSVRAAIRARSGSGRRLDSYQFAETSPVWFGQVGSTDPDAVRQYSRQLLLVLNEAEKEFKNGYGDHPLPKLLAHFQRARVQLEEMATSHIRG